MDQILPRVGTKFTSPTSSASNIVLMEDPIEILGLDPTQEPKLAGSVDPKNPLDVLLALPLAHYMERRLRGNNDDDCGSFSLRLHFTKSLGGILGENLTRGHDVVFDMENGRLGFAEKDCDYNRATE